MRLESDLGLGEEFLSKIRKAHQQEKDKREAAQLAFWLRRDCEHLLKESGNFSTPKKSLDQLMAIVPAFLAGMPPLLWAGSLNLEEITFKNDTKIVLSLTSEFGDRVKMGVITVAIKDFGEKLVLTPKGQAKILRPDCNGDLSLAVPTLGEIQDFRNIIVSVWPSATSDQQ